MDIVIDIHGYYGLRNQPFIKELAILSIQTNDSVVSCSIDKHYVFAPPYRWELLPKNSQDQYSKMFNTHGIPWQLGFYNPDLQSSILRDNIINARQLSITSLKPIKSSTNDKPSKPSEPSKYVKYKEGHYVFKPPCTWEELSERLQQYYKVDEENSKIKWEEGEYEASSQRQILNDWIKNADRVFVIDENIKNKLKKIVTINKPIICLNENLNVLFEYSTGAKCGWHYDPDESICTKKNAIRIRDFLNKRKHVVKDFDNKQRSKKK
ncbi:hypothetical protein KQX54_007811 [Cotesia glomerata]|uniref:Uncharacterized protein n=1 Tax=Cotesia glomerata TaxID=32391 RepID=A0AAV7INC4_COTGL|nr:hypothetical protein KQX54_007811 [Cotesia glomerata]